MGQLNTAMFLFSLLLSRQKQLGHDNFPCDILPVVGCCLASFIIHSGLCLVAGPCPSVADIVVASNTLDTRIPKQGPSTAYSLQKSSLCCRAG